jgi:signal transduction histidine kinase
LRLDEHEWEAAPSGAARTLGRHAVQLERLAEATHQIHATTTVQGAVLATVEAVRVVLDAHAAITVDGVATGAIESARHEHVLPLPSPHAPSRGTLTVGRGTELDRSEILIASQIARATALVLDRHRLSSAVEASLRARQEIVNVVSHDLRTPVHAFSLGIDALRVMARTDATVPVFARLDRSLRSMRRLLTDLLDVASIQDGALQLRPERHSIAAIVANVQAGCVDIARQKGLALVVGEVASGLLVCDGARIEQALTNLVSNALKFTQRGSVTLSAVADHDTIAFEVADTGVGIEPDARERLFERLYQDARTSTGGIGLGLYIVHGIAVAHAGRIFVESVVGQGSRFVLHIPLVATGSGQNGQP